MANQFVDQFFQEPAQRVMYETYKTKPAVMLQIKQVDEIFKHYDTIKKNSCRFVVNEENVTFPESFEVLNKIIYILATTETFERILSRVIVSELFDVFYNKLVEIVNPVVDEQVIQDKIKDALEKLTSSETLNINDRHYILNVDDENSINYLSEEKFTEIAIMQQVYLVQYNQDTAMIHENLSKFGRDYELFYKNYNSYITKYSYKINEITLSALKIINKITESDKISNWEQVIA